METFLRKAGALVVTALLMTQSSAALEVINGSVNDLRIEASYGFIGFGSEMPTCGSRVWVDMNTAVGRSAYATAMLAFALNKPIYIRGEDAGTRVFGACPLYDIFMLR